MTRCSGIPASRYPDLTLMKSVIVKKPPTGRGLLVAVQPGVTNWAERIRGRLISKRTLITLRQNPFEADSARPRVGYVEADHNSVAIPLKRHLETAPGELILVAGTEVAIFHPALLQN